MLPKSKRLSTKAFSEVIKKGQSFHSPFFIIRLSKTDKTSLFAVSVPKKVAKLAVSRNRIRRQVYSILSSLKLRMKPESSIIIIMKTGSDKLSFKDLGAEIEKIFVKLSLLK